MAAQDQGIFTQTVTIASGASLSGAATVNNAHLVGIVMPAAWTAATLTFQVSRDGTTFTDFYRDGAEYTRTEPTTAASRDIGISPGDFAGVAALKVRSGTGAAAVNQGADRVITLVFRHYR